MNPYGGVPRGRVVESFNPNERLLEWILSKENMETAWKRVKANHGAPGVKSRVALTNQVVFLGFTFRGTKIQWSEKAFREFSEAE